MSMKLRYKILGSLMLLFVVGISALAITIGFTADCEDPPALSGEGETMKAIIYRCYGPPEVLQLEEVEKPVVGEDEILVRVHAAGVNPLDWHFMRGSPYIMRLMSGLGRPDDIRLGRDFSGTVEAVGSNVQEFAAGETVFGGASGAFAEYVTVDKDRALAHMPDNLMFEQAASVPVAAITALQALRDSGKVQAGQKVLINGASGGVGTFAVQIAKALGAEVTGVCSTRNVDMVKSIGADHVIDYKKEDYTQGDRKYDLIIDNVGNHSLLKNRKVMTPEGRLVMVGGPSGNWVGPLIRPISAMIVSPFVEQQFVGILARLDPEDLRILAGMMASGQVTPVLDKLFELHEVPDAIRYSESGRARGKIVVSIN
jgi:NADPH:quinone reductase-like Zn-dependent oxidoreductase